MRLLEKWAFFGVEGVGRPSMQLIFAALEDVLLYLGFAALVHERDSYP